MTAHANRPPPDFYRVVRDGIDDVREYASWGGGWTIHRHMACAFGSKEAAGHGRIASEHVVPVRVTVRKAPRQHDFAWALRRMREGKRVRRGGWGPHAYCAEDCCEALGNSDLFAQDWQLWESP